MSDCQIVLWDEERFASAEEEWNGLLARSDSDPLFMSWQWQWHWWRRHREMLGARLCLLAVHADGELIGLAPFLLREVRLRNLVPIRRVEIIGGTWRDDTGVFSEYLDVIADRKESARTAAAVAGWLREQGGWQEAAFTCVHPSSVAARVAHELGQAVRVREVDAFEVHRIDLSSGFDEYIARLPAAARRKLIGQRSRLVHPRLIRVEPGDVEAVLGQMDEMIRRRWSRDPLSAVSRGFRADFCRDLAARGGLRLTALSSAEAPVSILYDIRAGGTEYYLQSGFDENHSRGVSLGYLHLGYAIEAACADGITSFDLLGGRGLNRDYKRDFGTVRETLVTLHIIRASWLRAAYRLSGRLKSPEPAA